MKAKRKRPARTLTAAERQAAFAATWWDARTAAAHLHVGKKFIYAACASMRLRHIKLAGRRSIRTTRAWCDAFLERDAVGGQEPANRVAVSIAEARAMRG